MPSPAEQVRRINRTWLVQGTLARDAGDYLDLLEKERPSDLEEACAQALAAAHRASDEHRDPKPDFYAALFSRATEEERGRFLKDHLWTRRLSGRFHGS